MISCIIPCYGSQNTIAYVVKELQEAFESRNVSDYEVILVNDSSPDGVYEVIRDICNNEPKVKALDLAKNFGQHNALMAGVKHAQGDVCVFLDDDGQTPGSEIWRLIDALEDGCDAVFAKYKNKRHSIWRNIGSSINDFMAKNLIGKPKNLSISSYFACRGFVSDEVKRYNGRYPYMAGLILRTTGRIKNVEITHRERKTGRSGYTMRKLLALWLNGFTAFSVRPLRIATIIGCVVATSGFAYGAFLVIRRFAVPEIPIGFTSLMAVQLLVGGMIMIMLGLIGEYVGRIYININSSPQYVVREKLGFDNCENEKLS